MSWEAMLPLGIISAMMFVMGTSQYVIHTTIYGKPKHPRHDAWDRAMDERDARLKEEYEKSQGETKHLLEATYKAILACRGHHSQSNPSSSKK